MTSPNFPAGLAAFLGQATARGVALPADFVMWLAAAPLPLDADQCSALFVGARSWPDPSAVESPR